MQRVLVIGAGSIGRRHLEASIELGNVVTVVDPKSELTSLALEFPGVEVHNSLESVAGNFDLAVVSNWAPDHILTVDRVLTLGLANKFLIEKPISNSFSGLTWLKNRAKRGDLVFAASMLKRYQGVDATVLELSSREISSISVHAGAQCHSTSGSHWLDFAMSIFRATPISVSANLKLDSINPRSPDLKFAGGIANYMFPEGQHLSMNWDNKSSMSALVRCMSRREEFRLLANGEIRHFSRGEDTEEGLNPIYKTGYGEERSVSIPLPLDVAIKTLHNKVLSGEVSRESMEWDLDSNWWMLAALLASDRKRDLSAPEIAACLSTGNQEWPVS